MSRPTFILTPTTNHPPSVYNNLATALFRHGYTSIKISLPTVLGPQSPVASSDFQPDVIALRNGLMTLVIEDEREVIVVMHGYSSLPGCEAVRGLSKRDREREGKRGGVIRLVFIMAWLPQEGFQSAERGDTSSFLPWVAVDEIVRSPPCSSLTLSLSPSSSPTSPQIPTRLTTQPTTGRNEYDQRAARAKDLIQRPPPRGSPVLDVTIAPAKSRRLLVPDILCCVAVHPEYVRALWTGSGRHSGVCRVDRASSEEVRGRVCLGSGGEV
ncbi:hypothetical protein BP5796_08446 [Coleophoma crateriformis]|uniref:AB hydrolase-1 domain-containing protein n=1 Tax=Coleophoma crateriformis TaxID=565419 RepID=A0A3D8R7N3_9HELO|nr:hypothetical protein BP5796_08446 [Coleophoma crateriformis]